MLAQHVENWEVLSPSKLIKSLASFEVIKDVDIIISLDDIKFHPIKDLN